MLLLLTCLFWHNVITIICLPWLETLTVSWIIPFHTQSKCYEFSLEIFHEFIPNATVSCIMIAISYSDRLPPSRLATLKAFYTYNLTWALLCFGKSNAINSSWSPTLPRKTILMKKNPPKKSKSMMIWISYTSLSHFFHLFLCLKNFFIDWKVCSE